jgi:ABC-2 type transport system ATP-binding protein
MRTTGELVIDTSGLSKRYHGVNALDALDLHVPRGSIFGFLGPNGAGKSTTIKLLLGLARPTSGSARIFGHDSVRESVAIRRRVGYLAQDPRYYDEMSARETLRFTAGFFFHERADIERRVGESLELVGLSAKADRPIKGFSGGERQRLGLAQAQVNTPDLLILDEPAASLDPRGRRDVLEVLTRLRERTTIFYSTHILDDVQRVSDTVAILNGGRLVVQAPIAELRQDREVVFTVRMRGDATNLKAVLTAESWVAAITSGITNDVTTLEIRVCDEQVAEARLSRLALADESVTVLSFGRRMPQLEDVFLQVVEGEVR